MVAEIKLERPDEHSHKVRVVGDIIVTNLEQPGRRMAAKAARYARTRAELEKTLKRAPGASDRIHLALRIVDANARLAGELREEVQRGAQQLVPSCLGHGQGRDLGHRRLI